MRDRRQAARPAARPWLTNLAAEPLRLLRLWDLPPEALQLLRFGRSLDNTRYKQAGFRYEYTNAGTVEAFAAGAAPRGDDRRQAPDVPLRARGRRLLPPLARRRSGTTDGSRLMEHVRVEHHDGVAVVTLVDLERRNAMTATMVDEIVETFDALEADGDDRRGRGHRRAARVLLGRRRRRASARCRDERDRRRTPLGHVDLRRLPPRAALAAADGRRGERPRGRRGHEPRARVRRAPRGRVGPLRHPVPARSACIPAAATSWMLDRAVGPQAAAAMVLFGVAGRRRPRRGDRPRVGVPSRRRAPRRGAHARAPAPPAPRSVCSTASRRRCARRRGSPTSTPRSRPRSTRQAWSLGQGWFNDARR